MTSAQPRGPLHETALDNARGRLLTLGAGLVAAAALVFTALNFSLLRRNSEQADQWQRRTHELTEQGQVTDRYTKAVEQLGSDKLDVRVGGIYALERIARDSPTDRQTVIAVLLAFIIEHSHEPWPPPGRPLMGDVERWTRPDVQAAVTVVGRRDPARNINRIVLSDVDLPAADFSEASLIGVEFTSADLTQAIFDDADLTGAELTGANLTSAYFRRAKLNGADLYMAAASYADLTGADLTGAEFGKADLRWAELTDADLTDVGLTEADLTDARWPKNAPVPEGWKLDTGSGRLRAADSGADPTKAT